MVADFTTTLGFEVVTSRGKSTTSTRPIALDDRLVAVLERQRRQQEADRAAAADYIETDLVVTAAQGGACHPQSLSRMLAQASVVAGLPRLTAHGLRHTSATLMLDAGVHPKVASERLGHADPSLFLAFYSHVTPTMQTEAAALVGATLFRHAE